MNKENEKGLSKALVTWEAFKQYHKHLLQFIEGGDEDALLTDFEDTEEEKEEW